MNKNQYKFTGNDESYTYKGLIEPLLALIEDWATENNLKDPIIWCPFDLEDDMEYNGFKLFRSNYVEVFRNAGYKVVCSHIATGQDFMEYVPEKWDIIISNPPFKEKRKFLERAYYWRKPFVLLNPLSAINDGLWNSIFAEDDLQLIIPNKRAIFFNENGCIGKSPSFKSGYICYRFLVDRQIKFLEIKNE